MARLVSLEKRATKSLYAALMQSFTKVQRGVSLTNLEAAVSRKDAVSVLAVVDAEERFSDAFRGGR